MLVRSKTFAKAGDQGLFDINNESCLLVSRVVPGYVEVIGERTSLLLLQRHTLVSEPSRMPRNGWLLL
jgi:hypothetical protein